MAYFLCVLGLALVLEGLPYFAFPEKMQSFLKKLPEIAPRNLRLYGMGAISIGLLLIYIARTYLR
jgi:hypothetical protein